MPTRRKAGLVRNHTAYGKSNMSEVLGDHGCIEPWTRGARAGVPGGSTHDSKLHVREAQIFPQFAS